MTGTWLELLSNILRRGQLVSPRGKQTKELLQHTIEVDMRSPVLTSATRAISYQFMAAEAFWILSGDDRVATIAPYNKNIAQFSDDGVKYFGAYGPKVVDQLPYVVTKLLADPDTRQAGLTIWRESPPKTKDVPCTVAIFFSLRRQNFDKPPLLNAHVFMRSSDAWLGVPYDVFNFSMLAHMVCGHLQKVTDGEHEARPGRLFLTMASSHLYQENWAAAEHCIDFPSTHDQAPTPSVLFLEANALMRTLQRLRDSKPGDRLRWWEGRWDGAPLEAPL